MRAHFYIVAYTIDGITKKLNPRFCKNVGLGKVCKINLGFD